MIHTHALNSEPLDVHSPADIKYQNPMPLSESQTINTLNTDNCQSQHQYSLKNKNDSILSITGEKQHNND